MNRKNWIIPIICTALLLSSCSDFLDEELQGVYSSETFYQTEEQAIEAINSSYNSIAFTDVANCLWVFGDVASDDSEKGGNAGDQSEIEYIDKFEANSDNGYIEYIWQHYYEGITQANNVIYYVPSINMDEELRDRIVGEAKYLRAYYYFNLVNIFGAIPLKTEAAFTATDLQVPLSSVENVYQMIENDLIDASEVLPSEYIASEIGRATQGAALGLLAKTYLFEEKWEESLQAVLDLEGLGIYSLMPIYRNNFEVDYENNTESIFEIQHLSGQDPSQGSYLNQWFSPTVENGYYFNAPTEDLISQFELTSEGIYDPRLDYSIGRDGNKWLNGEDFEASWSTTGYMGKKHIQPLSEIGVGVKGDADLNYTYMRYAEILLIKAEALNELGRTSEAIVPLNKIRERARDSYLTDTELDGYGTIPTDLLLAISSNNQSEIRVAIKHERRIELNLEFHRYFDLMRYGKEEAEKALSEKGFNYENNRYFPLPQSEIDTNNEI